MLTMLKRNATCSGKPMLLRLLHDHVEQEQRAEEPLICHNLKTHSWSDKQCFSAIKSQRRSPDCDCVLCFHCCSCLPSYLQQPLH